ncbi:MAG: response regulator transcription factor [Planctomycetota bacterium]|nr:response regulator transcription factor [Planctomycetota bacterium]
MNRPQVIAVDGHEPLLEQVQRLLASEFNVVGVFADGDSAIEAVVRLAPDVSVLDLSMPGPSVIEITRRARELNLDLKFVILTVHEDQDLARESFNAGASGYVAKSGIVSDLSVAIHEVLAGRSYISLSVNLESNP